MKKFIVFCMAAVAVMALSCGPAASGRCKNDYDCNGTEVCNIPTGKCIALVAIQCQGDKDCVDPQLVCTDHQCVPACKDQTGCAEGFNCVDRHCVK